MDKIELPAGIGPHEGRELELLLTGEKPVARFRLDGLSEEYETRFHEAVERGDILEFDFPAAELHLHRRFYCRRGEEWRVKVMDLIDRLLADRTLIGFSEEDLHRLDGTLLGYQKGDIDLSSSNAFVLDDNVRSRREADRNAGIDSPQSHTAEAGVHSTHRPRTEGSWIHCSTNREAK